MSSIKNINKQLIGDVNLDLGDDVFKFIQLLINKNKDYESIEKLYRSLPTGSIAKINHKLYPKKISELNDFEFIESNKDIVINLYNSIAQFNIHMKHINKFINYKLEFENLFLLGDYDTPKGLSRSCVVLVLAVPLPVCLRPWAVGVSALVV